jgi:hypothetical protein
MTSVSFDGKFVDPIRQGLTLSDMPSRSTVPANAQTVRIARTLSGVMRRGVKAGVVSNDYGHGG